MSNSRIRPLSKVSDGNIVSVVSLTGGRAMQARMTSMGVHVGEEIRVLHSGRDEGGPTLLAVGEARLAIGHEMAQKILVAVMAE